MKKKMLVMLLCSLLTIGMVGCGEDEDNAGNNVNTETNAETNVGTGGEIGAETEPTEPTTENATDENATEGTTEGAGDNAGAGESGEITDAADLLTKVWGSYEEADKFAVAGGDYDNSVMDAPGKFDITKVEDLEYMLGLPQNSASLIDDAASLMHMMNANTFTSAAFHLANAEDVQTLADALKENIMNKEWMCGFPDTLLIVSVDGEYVVSAFGNAEIMDTFKTKLLAQYDTAELLYEETITE